jgi:hypothetical protein
MNLSFQVAAQNPLGLAPKETSQVVLAAGGSVLPQLRLMPTTRGHNRWPARSLQAATMSDPVWAEFTFSLNTFYRGPNVAEVTLTDSDAQCAQLCSDGELCRLWSWCPSSKESKGYGAPAIACTAKLEGASMKAPERAGQSCAKKHGL